MRHYFLHYLDGEHVRLLGRKRAVVTGINHLKLLALLGAKVSIGDIVAVDSPVIQTLAADPDFRYFLREVDPGFLRLEALPVEGAGSLAERIALKAWERI